MASLCSLQALILLALYSVALITPTRSDDIDEERKVYIVYMGKVVQGNQTPQTHHSEVVLQQVFGSSFATQSLVRSYTRSFSGFAANLTAREHEMLARHEEVVSIFPSTTFHLQTTRSWDFMGLSGNSQRNPTVESDTIIGVIDSGIWPESMSFDDRGFAPPPKKWKGACRGGQNFTCNNKVIGARSYYRSNSARDTNGHGSHTASIAAGNHVKRASFYGIAEGTARGAVPSARIAVYKACHEKGCGAADIMAAFDDAIADGVDIITISIGGGNQMELQYDTVAIGALHAFEKGILVVQSAGNDGDEKGTVGSVVPWIFTVAASSTDREIVSKVALGNGTILTGKTVNSFSLNGSSFPLAYGKQVSKTCSEGDAMACDDHCLDERLVKGKIVMCRFAHGILDVFRAGALGSVLSLTEYFNEEELPSDVSEVVPFPASSLKEPDFHLVESYLRSTKFPKVNILKSESVRNRDAPGVASFSSKGPNKIIPDILKPDITAPGIEILAAFSPLASISDIYGDKRSVSYNILSGTSISCPHVAGAAAYVKSFHPDWSPSAIKSALMTTAWRMDSRKDSLAEFSYGVGHVDPVKALNPGLVYETLVEEYAQMLCGMGYDMAKITKIFRVNVTCPSRGQTTDVDLNYPSMTRQIKTSKRNQNMTFSENFTRTVTNVGVGKSTYNVTTSKGPDYKIKVSPGILTFGALNEKKSFKVIIEGTINLGKMVSASLEWSDGAHKVRSPIVVYPDDF